MSDYKNRKYSVIPYDPSWTGKFSVYEKCLREIFPVAQIEHIGSTSVFGMSGKPTIDVLIIVDDVKEAEQAVTTMERSGFSYEGAFVTTDSRLFRLMQVNELLANIHVFPINHPHNREMLGLRDYLCGHEEEVTAYSKLKESLHTMYANDYALYRKYKDEYVAALMKRVKLAK